MARGVKVVDEPLLTAKEVAERWNLTPDTVRTKYRAGMLRGVKLGPAKAHPIRFPLSAVVECERETGIFAN